MDLVMCKHPGGLWAVTEADLEALTHIKNDSLVMCHIVQQRNLQWHRRFFALMKVLFDNQERFANQEMMRKAILIELGFCDPQKLLDGTYIIVARSMSFNKMTQAEFESLWERCCDLIRREFLPEVTDEELATQVEGLIGDRRA